MFKMLFQIQTETSQLLSILHKPRIETESINELYTRLTKFVGLKLGWNSNLSLPRLIFYNMLHNVHVKIEQSIY